MDLKQLAYFVHVAETGSFTRAAAVLRVAQPALSRQVRALEVELRQVLLDRNGRGVTPTEAGKRMLAHARGILQQVQRAREDLEDQRGAASGRFAVALPPSIGRTLTAALVAAFRQQLPRAQLSVVEGLSAYALEWLAMGRVDCAVVYNATPSPAIDLQPVLDEPLFLVSARASQSRRSPAAAATSVSLAELADKPLVVPSRPHSMRMLLESALAAQGRRVHVAMEIESIPAILELASQGVGHAVLAAHAVRGSAHAGQLSLRPIGPPALTASLWIAKAAHRPAGPVVERGMSLLTQLLRAALLPEPEFSATPKGRPEGRPHRH
jgi:LysR family nitrogen assimilation transcriptional regulator